LYAQLAEQSAVGDLCGVGTSESADVPQNNLALATRSRLFGASLVAGIAVTHLAGSVRLPPMVASHSLFREPSPFLTNPKGARPSAPVAATLHFVSLLLGGTDIHASVRLQPWSRVGGVHFLELSPSAVSDYTRMKVKTPTKVLLPPRRSRIRQPLLSPQQPRKREPAVTKATPQKASEKLSEEGLK
jgi:hypothetical protein